MPTNEICPGSVYLFRVSDQLHGACRVDAVFPADSEVARDHYLNEAQEDCYMVSVTPWLGESPPAMDEPALRQTFHLTHHSWRNEPQHRVVNGPPPEEFELAGRTDFFRDLLSFTHKGQGFWNRPGFAEQLLRQREWDTGDPKEILAREAAEKRAAFEKKDRERQARVQRLAALGPEGLAAHTPFEKWQTRRIPSGAIVQAQALFHDAMQQIIGASPRSRKKVVLGALKTMVHGFNALQKQHKCLETWERDDLCSLMGDMLHVSKVTADPALLFEQWEDM